MQAQSAGSALSRLPERCRTLVASAGAVWIWPGIPLTMRRGTEIVPAPGAVIRFWVAQLHGPGALDKELSRAVSNAAQYLRHGEKNAAQHTLDILGLTSLSYDGAMLIHLLAKELGVRAPDMAIVPDRDSRTRVRSRSKLFSFH